MRKTALVAYILLIAACGGGGDTAIAPPPDVTFSEMRTYADHREIDVVWPNGDIGLSGTLFLPLEVGTYSAVVFHFGSNRWTRSDANFQGFTKQWLDEGIAALAYDKRGVGQSGGECCPYSDPGYFELLGTDVVSAVNALQQFAEIDPTKIGVWGFSQGGWVVPTAAASSPSVAFTIIGSGPTVTLEEEILYSEISGDASCVNSGLTDEEILAQMDAVGPGGFDPKSYIENMFSPAYWFYGTLDRSVPVSRSIAILEDIQATYGNPFEIQIVENANHVMIIGGEACQTAGQTADYFTPIAAWIHSVIDS